MELATQTEVRTGSLITEDALDGKIFSDGWHQTSERLEVHNPATGAHLASVGRAGRDHVFNASKLAAAAQPDWAAAPGPGARLRSSAPQPTCSRMPARRSSGGWSTRAAGSLRRLPSKSARPRRSCARRRRSPHWQSARYCRTSRGGAGSQATPGRRGRGHLAVELPDDPLDALGCPGAGARQLRLLKCDPQTPIAGGLILARPRRRPACPTNVFHVLPGGARARRGDLDPPEVRMISFTGSTRAGRPAASSPAAT